MTFPKNEVLIPKFEEGQNGRLTNMEDDKTENHQNGRRPKWSKSIKQGPQCGKKIIWNGNVISLLTQL